MEPDQIFRSNAPLQRKWSFLPLGDMLDESAERWGNRDALVFRDDRYTYREFKNQVDTLAKGLIDLGVRKGEHVGILMGNYPEYLFTQIACAKIGAVVVLINTRFKVSELEYILRQGDISTIVMNDLFLGKISYVDMLAEICPELPTAKPGNLQSATMPMLRNVIVFSPTGAKQAGTIPIQEVFKAGELGCKVELAERQRSIKIDDVAEILYTSGTTGYPKGAMRTFYHIARQQPIAIENMALSENDVLFNPNPFFHNLGNHYGALVSIKGGLKHVFAETFDPVLTMELMVREKVSVYGAYPPFFIMLMDHPDLPKYNLKATLRTGLTGFPGIQDPAAMFEQMRAVFGIPDMTSAYGMTECSGISTQSRVGDPPEVVVSTTGRLNFDAEAALIDPETKRSVATGEPGELWIRGPLVMAGYYNKPVETAAALDGNGWFHTKDLMSRDADGFFRFHGRISEMIKVGGENVDPLEVEIFISKHPKVAQVQVSSVPDRRLGDVTIAFVQLKKGETATDGEIVDFCRRKLASFKVPRYVKFVSEYPITASGKIQKYVLRQGAMEELGL